MSESAGLRLRRSSPADHEAAGAVTVAAYADFVVGAADAYVAKLRDSARRDLEAELWVATPAGTEEILGTVTICPPGSVWREIGRADEGEFRMLAVAPAARGRGVGAALVRLVVDRFRDDGAGAVVLSSLGVMTDAHRLYDRFGFARVPERDHSPAPGVDLIAYRKEL